MIQITEDEYKRLKIAESQLDVAITNFGYARIDSKVTPLGGWKEPDLVLPVQTTIWEVKFNRSFYTLDTIFISSVEKPTETFALNIFKENDTRDVSLVDGVSIKEYVIDVYLMPLGKTKKSAMGIKKTITGIAART